MPTNFERAKQVLDRRRETAEREAEQKMVASHGGDTSAPKRPMRAGEKIGRNDPCPCGSGKKYKQCCGR